MKRIKLFALGAVSIFAFVLSGCSDDDKKTGSDVYVENEKELSQEIFADDTSIQSGVTFVTAGAWTSSVSDITSTRSEAIAVPDWISIDPTSGDKASTYSINIELEPNYTGASRKAKITVYCNDDKIEITINQVATKEDGTKPINDIDNGTVFWDDTHWRMMRLEGSPKTFDNGNLIYEFNSSGKVISIIQPDSNYKVNIKYDNNGRMIEYKCFDAFTYKFEYVDHAKYIPVDISFVDFGTEVGSEYLLLKGLSVVRKTQTSDSPAYSMKFEEKGDGNLYTEYIGSNGYDHDSKSTVSISIEYDGDYPVTYTEKNLPYEQEEEALPLPSTREYGLDGHAAEFSYTYGVNHKFAKIKSQHFYYENKEWISSGSSEYISFVLNNTIYMLPKEENKEKLSSTLIEYDKYGRETKEYTPDHLYRRTYSDYKEDSKGNWIERTWKMVYGQESENGKDTRIFTY